MMGMNEEGSLTGNVGFLLGKLGQVASNRFAERLAAIGLRPRHCWLLESLRAAPTNQLDLARRLDVAPSVVVDMVDELERLEAVRRVRDTRDRRRQYVELTATGRTLLGRAARVGRDLDVELLAELSARQRTALRDALGVIAAANGLPTG